MAATATRVSTNETAARLRVVVARLFRQIRQSGFGGLSPSQWSAIVTVEEAGRLRIGDIAERERVSAPTATRLTATLAEAGLVAREADPADRRTCWVSLTDAGRDKLEWARTAAVARLSERLAGLGDDEIAVIGDALPVLEQLLDPPPAALSD